MTTESRVVFGPKTLVELSLSLLIMVTTCEGLVRMSTFGICRSVTEDAGSRANQFQLFEHQGAKDGTLEDTETLQNILERRELDTRKQKWMEHVSKLPFECTACGKCCKTIGNVFMTPDEVVEAADFLNVTTSAFVKEYSSKILESSTVSSLQEEPWILLKDTTTDIGPACIFLDLDTNFCKIYEARPVQCSTYPFWSNVMEVEKWNAEVRHQDEDSTSNLSIWTSEEGGCEGMEILTDENTSSNSDGVELYDALKQLSLYELADRRLPRQFKD